MALTKIITDTIDLSSDTTALKMPKGTTAERQIEYLVVAGGGGGAGSSNGGGGGGAGGLLSGTTDMIATTNLTITVGTGGAGTIGEGAGDVGGDGNNSVFDNITATGGGGAANTGASSSNNGGSGGGASGGTVITPGNGITQQGNNGGTGSNPTDIGGGGGGAGGVGQPGGSLGSIPSSGTFTGTDGQGGAALSNSITGTPTLYAGGGGGGVCDFVYNVGTPATSGLGGAGVAGTGGNGGQSDGSTTGIVNGGNGTANTGGGGGGGSRSIGGTCNGGDGGSGIVILRYASKYTLVNNTPGTLTTGVLNGTVGDDKYTTFTAGTGTISGLSFDLEIGTTRENTTTGKMEIYTGAKGWRALQQTGQDVGVVPTNNFNTVLYTGNSTVPYASTGPQQDIDIGFTTDLTWVKVLGNGTVAGSSTVIYDVTRGNYQYMYVGSSGYSGGSGLASNAGIGAITNGFSVLDTGIGSSLGGAYGVNGSPGSAYGNGQYVSWSWKAGGTPISNPDGTTTSTISLNSDAGFSIVKTASVGGLINVGHGLGATPEFIMLKGITNVGFALDWNIWHKSIGTDAYLSTSESGGTSAVQSRSGSFPTVNTTIFENNWTGSSSEYVAYCWRSIPGYSLIGSYTGTENADFPIIYTGFEPAWLMIKRTDSTGDWYVWDNKRSTSNLRLNTLDLNTSDPELASSGIAGVRFLNNGFQVQSIYTFNNAAGGDYIFMCFAS